MKDVVTHRRSDLSYSILAKGAPGHPSIKQSDEITELQYIELKSSDHLETYPISQRYDDFVYFRLCEILW